MQDTRIDIFPFPFLQLRVDEVEIEHGPSSGVYRPISVVRGGRREGGETKTGNESVI